MKGNKIVRAIMDTQGVTPTQLGKRMGNKPVRLITDRLASKNLTLNKLNDMLLVLDYKLVIMPSNTRIPENSYVVDDNDEPTPPKEKPDLDKLLSDDTPKPKSSNQRIKLT